LTERTNPNLYCLMPKAREQDWGVTGLFSPKEPVPMAIEIFFLCLVFGSKLSL